MGDAVKNKVSLIGIVCLIAALAILASYDVLVLLVVGFFYYAYKLLYRKETASRLDMVIIIAMFVVLIALIMAWSIYSLVIYPETLLNQTGI
ncbi:MAG: hypothetical protein V1678_05450 [Candidatus Aenigmatarchaeota archaeon]